MTDELPERARRAFGRHDAYHESGDAYALETTAFDSRVTASETDSWALRYTLTVRTPTLDSAVEEDVGPTVQEGWFETFGLRLEDAPGAVRDNIELDDLTVETEDGDAIVTVTFLFGNADRAPDVAKSMAEYVEGTYVAGVVPGYTYRPPVSDLLARASHDGNGGQGGPMPL